MSIIECDRVTKSFGAVTAVDALTFSITAPGVAALLGSNGAGKTTTIDMLTGVRRPDNGCVRVFGADPTSAKTRTHIGCVPQRSGGGRIIREGAPKEIRVSRPSSRRTATSHLRLARYSRRIGGGAQMNLAA